MPTISVYIPKDLIEKIDKFVKSKKSRSKITAESYMLWLKLKGGVK